MASSVAICRPTRLRRRTLSLPRAGVGVTSATCTTRERCYGRVHDCLVTPRREVVASAEAAVTERPVS